LSIECLFKILKKALPIVFTNMKAFEGMWPDLATTFDDFLFTKNVANTELPIEVIQKDELIDCQLIELIRDDILINADKLPHDFIEHLLALLNRGSIYSNLNENFLDLDSNRKLREEFSKICFEALLKFSFVHSKETILTTSNTNDTNNTITKSDGSNLTKMALLSMLNRCKDIIQRYIHDERLNGTIPLPRYYYFIKNIE
jgi:hypothetical protein